MCDNAHETLAGPVQPRLHWSVPDPVRIGTDKAFEAAYADLAERIDRVGPAVFATRHGADNATARPD